LHLILKHKLFSLNTFNFRKNLFDLAKKYIDFGLHRLKNIKNNNENANSLLYLDCLMVWQYMTTLIKIIDILLKSDVYISILNTF